MIRSMTAFAREMESNDQGRLIWELRSVNHRFLEVNVRLPEELRALEPLVRERIAQRLARGKVDCTLRYEPAAAAGSAVKVNERLALQLIEAAGAVGHLLHEAVPPRTMEILSWPGVLEIEGQDLSPVQRGAEQLLNAALKGLVEVREREGARLGEMIRQRCATLAEQVEQVRRQMPAILEGLRERLRTRLAEVAQEIDQTRLEQEMVLLAQRMDVAEEMDRLGSHVEEVRGTLGRNEPVGRRLDFLMQELNREANTLSSKSTNAEITRIGVEMKVLIEQMREQVQNIE